jgi:hypothetical protein
MLGECVWEPCVKQVLVLQHKAGNGNDVSSYSTPSP